MVCKSGSSRVLADGIGIVVNHGEAIPELAWNPEWLDGDGTAWPRYTEGNDVTKTDTAWP